MAAVSAEGVGVQAQIIDEALLLLQQLVEALVRSVIRWHDDINRVAYVTCSIALPYTACFGP